MWFKASNFYFPLLDRTRGWSSPTLEYSCTRISACLSGNTCVCSKNWCQGVSSFPFFPAIYILLGNSVLFVFFLPFLFLFFFHLVYCSLSPYFFLCLYVLLSASLCEFIPTISVYSNFVFLICFSSCYQILLLASEVSQGKLFEMTEWNRIKCCYTILIRPGITYWWKSQLAVLETTNCN